MDDARQRAAEAAYTEALVELRLKEGGGFKVASQQRRALQAALDAADDWDPLRDEQCLTDALQQYALDHDRDGSKSWADYARAIIDATRRP